jgi:hypothetical protein
MNVMNLAYGDCHATCSYIPPNEENYTKGGVYEALRAMTPSDKFKMLFGVFIMNTMPPTEQDLISIITKGSVIKTAVFDLIIRIATIALPYIAPFVLTEKTKWKALSSQLSFKIYFGIVIAAMLLSIVPYIINHSKKFKRSKNPIENLLKEMCKLFDAAIMPGGDARATIYIYRKHSGRKHFGTKTKKVDDKCGHGYFWRLCDTEGSNNIVCRNEHELSCFSAYWNKGRQAFFTDLRPKEKKKSTRDNIQSVFSLSIYEKIIK